jgi:hypothetical protein
MIAINRAALLIYAFLLTLLLIKEMPKRSVQVSGPKAEVLAHSPVKMMTASSLAYSPTGLLT